MTQLRHLLLTLICLAGFASVQAKSPSDNEQKTFGLMQHILKKGQTLQITYYPIEDAQSYIDQVLIKKTKPDIKTGEKTATVRITLVSQKQTAELLNAVQKEQFQIIVFTPKEGQDACILWRLDPKHFGSKRFETTAIRPMEE